MRIPITEKISLIDLLHKTFPESSTTKIKKMIQKGCVEYRSAVLKHPEFIFQKGDSIQFHKYEARKTYREKSPVPVLFEDEFLIAVLKPQGMAVERSTEKRSSLFSLVHSYLSKKTKGREKPYFEAGIEWDEAGICVFAKSDFIQKMLTGRLAKAKRSYWALVENAPQFKKAKLLAKAPKIVEEKEDTKKEGSKKRKPEEEVEEPKTRSINYDTVSKHENYSLITVECEGYKKQEIRRILAENNIPIIGDRKYGNNKKSTEFLKIFNYRIEFLHPKTGRKIMLETSMPATFNPVQQQAEQE